MKGYTIVRLPKEEENTERFGVEKGEKGIVAELDIRKEDFALTIPFLFVSEKERRKGIGTMLLQEVIRPLAGKDIFIPVEMSFTDEDSGLREFMEAQPNFTLTRDKDLFRIPADALKNNEKLQKLKEAAGGTKKFFSLNKKQRFIFFEELQRAGFEGYVEDDKESYEKELSLAVLEDDRVTGAIFVTAHSEKELELSFIYVVANHPKTAIALLGTALKKAEKLYPDAEVWFNAITPESVGAAEGIFKGEAEPETIYTARWNGWSDEEPGEAAGLADADTE